jgi:hypothetical protein
MGDAPENEPSSFFLRSALMFLAAFALGIVLCGFFLAGFLLGRAQHPPAVAAADPATNRNNAASEIHSDEPAPLNAAASEDGEQTEAASPAANAENAPGREAVAGSDSSPPPRDDVDSALEDVAAGDAPSAAAKSAADATPPPEPDLLPGMRNWSDSTGEFKVVAQFVSFDDKLVRLRMQDEKVVAVPIDRLSEADQKFVLEQPPEPGIDLPPGPEVTAGEPGAEEAIPSFAPRGDPSAPLFGNAPYNPPPRSKGRSRPRLKYPGAEPRTWTPYSHEPFLGVFHDLEAGRLSIRIHNGIVLSGPVLDMSPQDLEYIKSMTGEELYQQEVAAPPAAFDEPSRRTP